MKCNLCNKEMTKGFVQSKTRMYWCKEKHKMIFSPKKKGEFFLSQMDFFGSSMVSYHCEACKIIVTPYEDMSW